MQKPGACHVQLRSVIIPRGSATPRIAQISSRYAVTDVGIVTALVSQVSVELNEGHSMGEGSSG